MMGSFSSAVFIHDASDTEIQMVMLDQDAVLKHRQERLGEV